MHTSGQDRLLLQQYKAAWENGDVATLEELGRHGTVNMGLLAWKLHKAFASAAGRQHWRRRATRRGTRRRVCAVAVAVAVVWPTFAETHNAITAEETWYRFSCLKRGVPLRDPRLEPRGMIKASQTISASPAAIHGRMVWLRGHVHATA